MAAMLVDIGRTKPLVPSQPVCFTSGRLGERLQTLNQHSGYDVTRTPKIS